jgi:hypothetical protein
LEDKEGLNLDMIYNALGYLLVIILVDFICLLTEELKHGVNTY